MTAGVPMHRIFLAIALAAAPAVALGQEAPAPTATDRFNVSVAEAERLYAAGDHQGAINAYLDAYGAVPTNDVLYNVAYIYEKNLGKLEFARDFYQRIIRSPDASADLIRRSTERLTGIDAKLAARTVETRVLEEPPAAPTTPAPAPQPAPQPAPAPPPKRPSVAPWILTGVGVAVIGGGVGAGAAAAATNRQFQAADDNPALQGELYTRGKTQAAVADGMYIGGAVIAVAGLSWGIATLVGHKDKAAVHVVPGLTGATLFASF